MYQLFDCELSVYFKLKCFPIIKSNSKCLEFVFEMEIDEFFYKIELKNCVLREIAKKNSKKLQLEIMN